MLENKSLFEREPVDPFSEPTEVIIRVIWYTGTFTCLVTAFIALAWYISGNPPGWGYSILVLAGISISIFCFLIVRPSKIIESRIVDSKDEKLAHRLYAEHHYPSHGNQQTKSHEEYQKKLYLFIKGLNVEDQQDFRRFFDLSEGEFNLMLDKLLKKEEAECQV